jgi:hypothetical protein
MGRLEQGMTEAYRQGFMSKCAEAGVPVTAALGMLKQAKNMTRFLARVGPNLAGATERDLKFLSRRGLKGLSPEQVLALREKGMLPSVEQELAGFDRGTERMLGWTPKSRTPRPELPPEPDTNLPFRQWAEANSAYRAARDAQFNWDRKHWFTEPAKKITRTNAPDAKYGVRLNRREITIPDLQAPGSLAEREARSATARHEAREWVRGNAQVSKGLDTNLPGRQGIFGFGANPEIGTSHIPGVIRDERIFRSQLLNRLGSPVAWDKAPLGAGVENGAYYVRGPRDAFTGNKPLPYEFEKIKEWRGISKKQRLRMDGLRRKAYAAAARGPESQEMNQSISELISNPELADLGLTPQQARRLLAASSSGFDPYNSVTKIVGSRWGDGVSEARRKALDALEEIINPVRFYKKPNEVVYRLPTYKTLTDALNREGVDWRRYVDILNGESIYLPKGSELDRLRDLSIYPTRIEASELPSLYPRPARKMTPASAPAPAPVHAGGEARRDGNVIPSIRHRILRMFGLA